MNRGWTVAGVYHTRGPTRGETISAARTGRHVGWSPPEGAASSKAFAPTASGVQARPPMKRPSLCRIAIPLAACLALATSSCGVLGKKAAKDGEAATETAPTTEDAGSGTKKKDSEATPDAPSSDSLKAGEKKSDDGAAVGAAAGEKKKDGAQDGSDPAAVADPLAAEEFKGLPKDEAEFILACRALAAGGKATMTGKDGMVFETRELAGLGTNTRPGTPRHEAMIASIKAKADALRAAGIELVIAPVPTKPVVYPDYLGAEPALKDRRYDSYLQSVYTDLQKAGVFVADTTKALRSDRFDRNAASFPKAGVLWSPAAAATTARSVFGAVRKSAAAKAIARDKTIVSRASALTQNGETFKVQSVGWAQGDQLIPATVPKEGAPVVVVGDDHSAAHRTGGVNASLADALSLSFGASVDTRAASGTGWKEAIEFTPGQNSTTKVIVWCFSSASFLDSPTPPKKPSARPRRPSARVDDDGSPAPRPMPGAGLKLRDDPGLDARVE